MITMIIECNFIKKGNGISIRWIMYTFSKSRVVTNKNQKLDCLNCGVDVVKYLQ